MLAKYECAVQANSHTQIYAQIQTIQIEVYVTSEFWSKLLEFFY